MWERKGGRRGMYACVCVHMCVFMSTRVYRIIEHRGVHEHPHALYHQT